MLTELFTSQARGINDLGLQGNGLQLLGRDLEGDPCGKNLLLLRWRGGTQREAHMTSFMGHPFVHSATFYYRPLPARPCSGRQGEHSPSQISWFGMGEAGTKPCSDSRGKGLAGRQHRDMGA